jgi:hypothetical protein
LCALFASAIANLKPARTLTSVDDLDALVAQLDLSNRPAGGVNLSQHYARASLLAPRRPAGA